jgi:hypothetical protein
MMTSAEKADRKPQHRRLALVIRQRVLGQIGLEARRNVDVEEEHIVADLGDLVARVSDQKLDAVALIGPAGELENGGGAACCRRILAGSRSNRHHGGRFQIGRRPGLGAHGDVSSGPEHDEADRCADGDQGHGAPQGPHHGAGRHLA